MRSVTSSPPPTGQAITPDETERLGLIIASGVNDEEAHGDADDVLRWEGVPPMFAFRDLDGNGMEIVEQR